MAVRTPPGRLGHLWLRERLDVARHASDVLEEKTRALAAEERRLRVLEARGRAAWGDAWEEASRWLLRASLLGGRREIVAAGAEPGDRADARIRWASNMGATYPTEAGCRLPDVSTDAVHAGAAMHFAVRAHRDAIEAAVRYAADLRALEVVRRELSAAGRRQRAIERRWIPRLESAIAEVERSLEELDREEVVRAKWVSERGEEGSR